MFVRVGPFPAQAAPAAQRRRSATRARAGVPGRDRGGDSWAEIRISDLNRQPPRKPGGTGCRRGPRGSRWVGSIGRGLATSRRAAEGPAGSGAEAWARSPRPEDGEAGHRIRPQRSAMCAPPACQDAAPRVKPARRRSRSPAALHRASTSSHPPPLRLPAHTAHTRPGPGGRSASGASRPRVPHPMTHPGAARPGRHGVRSLSDSRPLFHVNIYECDTCRETFNARV